MADVFAPNPAFRHTLLSGIEINQNVLSQKAAFPTMEFQTFRLPVNYKRAGVDIPDITGLQICVDTVGAGDEEENLMDIDVEILFQVNQFGDWVDLAHGDVEGFAVGDEQEWIDVYFNEPITVNNDWLQHQFRLGIRSTQEVWYSYPPVMTNESITTAGGNLAFRLLTNTADSGTDFLSNGYRSMVKKLGSESFSTVSSPDANAFWYSKPNPSKFSVESLYFDVRDTNRKESVVDRLLLDPVTPGVYFNLYYSSDGQAGTSDSDWENKIWTPVYQTYHATRREEHALPEPVSAKYMKVEFSHLQASHYSPGTFSQPTRYKKHPKWVLNYFLARLNGQQSSEDPYVARKVRVVYNALQLGYDYYLDDLHQDPADPNIIQNTTALTSFLSDRSDVSEQVDPSTYARIQGSLQPYTQQPAERSSGLNYLISTYSLDRIDTNYPTETVNSATANTIQVSQLDREQVIVEQNMPVMFFYVPCKHIYKELEANFANDKAYFVGVRELAFTREHYTVASDNDMYVENLVDFTNLRRNDFAEETVDD